MKERFIQRFKKSINKYFNTGKGDPDARLIRNYIISEYEHILEEEFGMSHDETRAIYDELYRQYYGKEE